MSRTPKTPKKWVEVNDQPGGMYITNKQIWFKTSMLQSDICDLSGAYIAVKETITVDWAAYKDKYNTKLVLKICVLFTSSI